MCAYIIIAAELAILYAFFWYVFLRKPKPFSITDQQWGFYQSKPGESTMYDIDWADSISNHDRQLSKKIVWISHEYCINCKRIYAKTRTPHCPKANSPIRAKRLGWVVQGPIPAEILEQMLHSLTQTIPETNVTAL